MSAQYAEKLAALRNERMYNDFEEAPLGEVMQSMYHRARLPILVDWYGMDEAAIDENTRVTLKMNDAPLADALDALLAKLGAETETDLGYEIVPVILIAPRRNLPARPVKIATTPYNDRTEASAAIWRVHATRDPTSPTGYYIPKDLEDAFAELNRMLHPDLIEMMRTKSEEEMVQYHFGLGQWMRNNWGLWGESSRLGDYFESIGIEQPDDMSGIILDSYWRRLNSQPLRLDEQVTSYQEYWRKQKEAASQPE